MPIFAKGIEENKEEKKEEKEDEVVTDIVSKHRDHPHQGDAGRKKAWYRAFYEGHQWTKIKDNKIESAKKKAGLLHYSKINKIKPNCQVAVSRLVKEQPEVLAEPIGIDQRNEQTARAASQLLVNAWESNEHNLIVKEYAAGKNAYVTGNSYWKIVWDPTKYATVSKAGMYADKDDDGNEIEGTKKWRDSTEKMVGDWNCTVHDDFDVYADPSARDYWDIQWMIHRYTAPVAELKRTYKEFADGIEVMAASEVEEDRYLYVTKEYKSTDEIFKDRAFVLEYWERPTAENKNGRKVVIINNFLKVYDKGNPHAKFGQQFSLPFAPFWWDKESDKFMGVSAVKDQISPQKDTNLLYSLIMINARLTASKKWGFPKGTLPNINTMTNLPNVFEFNQYGGGQPVGIGGDPLPDYVSRHLQTLDAAQRDIAGVHEISQAQMPERGTGLPAAGMKILMDSEAVKDAPNMRHLKMSLTIAAEIILRLIRHHYKEPRYMKILGEGNKYELKAFMGSDLEGSFNIVLKVSSAMNTSAAAKTDVAMNLWDREVFQAAMDPNDPRHKAAKKLLQVLEFGSLDKLYKTDRLQENKARLNLELVRAGEMPDITEAEDPSVMLQHIGDFMLTEEFLELDDDMQDAIISMYASYKQNAQMGQPQPEGAPPQAGAPVDAAQQEQAMMTGEQSPIPEPIPGGGPLPQSEVLPQ